MNRNLAELDHRESNGISVTLLWNRATDRLLVRVEDDRAEEDFELECAPHEALDVFHHPLAFAARRPVRHLLRTAA
jgi:hypothetical protein